MPYTTHGDFLNASDKLLAAARPLAGPPVEELRLELEKDTTSMREAQARRNMHKAAAQEASRDFDNALESAKKGYSRLRHLLIAMFGLSAEKLAEFGLQPFRPPQGLTEKKVELFLKRQKPPENGQSPTQAARSETESST